MGRKRRKASCSANFKSESEDLDDVITNFLVEGKSFKLSLPKLQEEGPWSLLPDLLLWMIKDKLDIFDNMRLAAVCRGWRSASACYPKKLQSVGDGFPWIMQSSKYIKSSAREFVSIMRSLKFTVDLPEFSEATVVFSKQGWLLVQRPNFSKPRTRSSKSRIRLSNSLFLINVFTNSKIKMPDAITSVGVYCGSFSTVEGYPHFVVLLDHNSDQVTFWVAYPGDEAWTKHSNLGQRMRLEGIMSLVIFRQDVFCYDLLGNMITYNISSHLWKEILGPGNQLPQGYMMEHEGKIVKLVHNDIGSFSLFRYSDVDATWEKKNIEDEKDTCWFLSRVRNSFSAKGKGLKVYSLHPRASPGYQGAVVSVRDLMSAQCRRLPYKLSDLCATWVDIG